MVKKNNRFIFNQGFVSAPVGDCLSDMPADLLAVEDPLIDDVDTTITSFMKMYGQPPHLDIDDADDSDFDDFDDVDDDVDVVEVSKPVEKPVEESVVEKEVGDGTSELGDASSN